MSSNPMYVDYVDTAGPYPARSRGWRVLGWISVALAVVMVVGCLGAYAEYLKIFNNINHEDINSQINAASRPKKLNNAVNILLMGSDNRSGSNAKYGKDAPGGSDTLILMHLSPGGGQATGISFPRDLMVPVPACKGKPAQSVAQINSAYIKGGPVCTLNTIEQMTRIHIDHFMVVDFSGFKSVVNALGGVTICLPQAVNDKDSKLHLSKGFHVVKGDQALAYVRNRHGLGDGSDLGRVKRQQQFLASVAKKALSAGTLTNPARMLALLNAGTKSLTTDSGFGVSQMLSLGGKLQGLTSGKVKFATVPYQAYAPDPNRVALASSASTLFTELRNDTKLDATVTASPSASPKVPASQVKVRIFNTSGVQGKAGRVSDQLRSLGYQVLKVGNAATRTSQITYGTGGAPSAQTLAGAVSGLTPVASAKTPAGVVDVYVGATFPTIKGASKSSLPSKLSGEINGDSNLCKN
jgi:LCP family protein required for cell wall assembly